MEIKTVEYTLYPKDSALEHFMCGVLPYEVKESKGENSTKSLFPAMCLNRKRKDGMD